MKMTNNTDEFFRNNPWEVIREPIYPEGRRLYLHDERFWVSMDDERKILFFVQDKGAEKIKPLENLSGLQVSIESCSNGDQRLVCRLESLEPELVEKFATVAKDIAFYCSAYKGAQLFLKTQERIKSWANFLRPSRAGLTHSEFVGLLGELYVLSEHLITLLMPGDAVRAWIGPEGKKQDFTFGNSAIEVKTTVSGSQQTISISSLDQLDRITDKLYLMRVVASPSSDSSGFALRDLYEQCLQAVGQDIVAEGLFLQKVSELYGKANKSQRNDHFLIVSETIFDVDNSFPKLTRSAIGSAGSAIQEARYDIFVSAIRSFEVPIGVKDILSHE